MICRVTGIRRTHLSERFATLALLILGEGIIGYAITLQQSTLNLTVPRGLLLVVGGVGFGTPAGLAIVMVCVIIYLLWVYYFSTFIERAERDVIHAYAWAFADYPFHVALILVLQAGNSLMLYANTFNAINGLGTGDSKQVGDIMSTFWPALNGTNRNQTLVVGHTNLTWNPTGYYNETFLDQFSEKGLAVLVFTILEKIFESYSLHLPLDYESTLEALAGGVKTANENTYTQLLLILLNRFIVSAIYYLVACVRHIDFLIGG